MPIYFFPNPNDYNSTFVENNFETIMHQLTDHKHDEFQNYVLTFANSYANQVQIDYNFFVELLNDGELWEYLIKTHQINIKGNQGYNLLAKDIPDSP